MPAAVVIPALRVSVMNVAVKMSVVVSCVCLCVSLNMSVHSACGMHMTRLAADEGHRMVWREVKCDDPDWTN